MIIESGNTTLLVEDQIRSMENTIIDNDNVTDIVAFLSDIASQNMFERGVQKYTKEKGYTDVLLCGKELSKLVQDLFSKNNVVKAEDGKKEIFVSRQTITNWFVKGAPDDKVNTRDNVFALCFALKLSIKETIEFFLKYYQVIPFNLRRLEECVYYYCLSNGRTFIDARSIIGKLKGEIKVKSVANYKIQNEDYTKFALDVLPEKRNDAEFEMFVKENLSYFDTINEGAIRKVEAEYNESKKMISKDAQAMYELIKYNRSLNGDSADKLYDDIYDNISKIRTGDAVNVKSVLEYITGISHYQLAKEDTKNKNKLKQINTLLKKMPQKIRINLPDEQRVGSILNRDPDKKHNADSIRKSLILFKFFNYYMQLSISSNELNDIVYNSNNFYMDACEDFIQEMNTCLASCGYFELYARNPYDCMFLISARQEDPIFALQTIIDSYLDFSE